MSGGITRVPLSLVQARGKAGDPVVFNGAGLNTEQGTDTNAKLVGGTLDSATGTLNLKLSDGSTIKIEGFATPSSITQGGIPGPQGLPGRDGVNGLDGRDGERGPTGFQGPQGPRGVAGPQGERGPQGPQGPQGPTGPQGLRGDDGFVQIWIQNDPPEETNGAAVVAGALWVKP